MQIVQATPRDAAAVAELAATTLPLACPPGDPQEDINTFIASELTTDRFASHLTQPTRTVLIATEDDRLLGYVLVVHEPPTDPEVRAALHAAPTAELSKCYVRAEWHGRGIAPQLLTAAAEDAAARGARTLWLGVSSVNGRAQRFYEKNGFRPVGHKDFQVGGQQYRDVVLERSLDV